MNFTFSYPPLFFLLLSLPAWCQNEVRTASTIEQVTVFLNRAQVTSKANVTLLPGKNTVVLHGLPKDVVRESIQVKGKGNFTIQGVQYEINYLTEQEKSLRLEELQDSLKINQEQRTDLEDRLDVFRKEEDMLITNKSIKGDAEGVLVDELRMMAEFYRGRLMEIKQFSRKLMRQIDQLKAEENRLGLQIKQLRSNRYEPTSEISVGLLAKTGTRAELEVNYLVSKAGWYPSYDIRVESINSPARLAYKANVYQNTGVDWENVKLTLSTSDPAQNGQKPDLSTLYLNLYEPVQVKPAARYKKMAAESNAAYDMASGAVADEFGDYEETEEVLAEADNSANYTTVEAKGLSVEFDIALRYTIPSSNKPELVDIQNHELDAEYEYATVPKMEESAFLMARLKGWGELNLLPGKANIYYEGTFIGDAQINPNSTDEKLPISLGKDPRVVVKREKINDYTSKKFLGSHKTEAYGFTITLKNTRKEAIDIRVEDQIPVSSRKEITVEPIELSGAAHTQFNGKTVWNLNLAPNQSKELVLKYEIKYPKDAQLNRTPY